MPEAQAFTIMPLDVGLFFPPRSDAPNAIEPDDDGDDCDTPIILED
jgi:hypothetical protein